ncbi:pyridoxal phosphate-dependent transferase [Chaetomium fimeti]|uniref:aromatic-amino-acid transaminase n=1 Tax=Chaetomium fimeti TaxID=1854472 RepID=A0AAE0HQ33_9PEZI|nr:pyridoxal phosphate-dependent transferase [Chaetomium fimeti]
MRSAIRTGALRGLPPSTTAPLHSGMKTARSCTPRRVSVPPASAFHSKSPDYSEAPAAAAKLPEAEPTPPPTPRDRITLADIKERRAKAGRLIAPTAASCNADMFKAPQTTGKPKAKRWDHLLTKESTLRAPCKLKQAAKNLNNPGLISLGGGLPCPEYFPISSLTLHIPNPPHFSETATLAGGTDATIGKYDASAAPTPTPTPNPNPETTTAAAPEYDLSIALNYGQATGSAQMTRFATEHVELLGAPPYADWGVCLTIGSTGALEQALRMLCDGPGRGDTLLTEEFSFSTALETAAPLRVGVVGVEMDGEGLVPEAMERVLDGWDVEARGGRAKPRVLYTVPSGQNPTGATQSVQRRGAIYEVARRHDVFILEDEPYYYLQMQEPGTEPPASVEAFLEGLIPTYLSMDVDGRVMRMDSFSKVVVPGSRMGWITASEQIVERFIRHAEVANQGPNGFSQVILHKLLDERWGHEGYFRWLMNLRMEYTKRRDAMSAACDEFLPKEVVSWQPPQAGMFQWLKVNYELHPSASTKSIMDIEEEIFNSCISKGVLVARGSWFRAEQDIPPSGLYLRATYAAATPENMREAIRRLGEAIRESYQL